MSMFDILEREGVRVESWDKHKLGFMSKMMLIQMGTYAFVDGRESDVIYTVDQCWDPNVSEYILAHEFGHILCRREQSNPVTAAYDMLAYNDELKEDITFLGMLEVLKMHEEYLVDMFAVCFLSKNGCLNEMERTHVSERFAHLSKLIPKDVRDALDAKAEEMSVKLAY